MTDKSDIPSVRDGIDRIDSELLKLVNQRIELARDIGKLKEKKDGEAPRYYRPEREAQVLRRLKEENAGRLRDEQLELLFREVMSICRGAEGKLKVATLGPAGTFSEQAARQHFGSSVEIELKSTMGEVFKAVETSAANFGVVPIENSTGGGVTPTTDRMVSASARVSGEIFMPVHQVLLAKNADVDYADVEWIYSHSQSISQCQNWITEHLPRAEVVRVASNGEAARLAAKEDNAVAIAGEMAAMHYDVQIIERNIEDEPNNTTRFFVLSNDDVAPSGRDRTSILVSPRNQPGALYDLLKSLSDYGLNMTRIESRPSRTRQWDYILFVDFMGHVEDEGVREALELLEKDAVFFRFLGSYPRAD